jgi:hypothetical protein
MFFYTIMKLFITLPDNLNKPRTSAGRLFLNNLQGRNSPAPIPQFYNIMYSSHATQYAYKQIVVKCQ